MAEYKIAFVEFMIESQVLCFGDFVTKSGRSTPYFINTGRYRNGTQMNRLAGFYADAIEARGSEFDFLFGPAYKGIPLAVATAMELARRGRDVPFCFNRKEAKDHGEGGVLVGHTPESGERALIIEDVTTAGTSIRETVPLLRAAASVEIVGLVVSVDRMEKGAENPASKTTEASPNPSRSALQELAETFSMDTFAIVTIEEIMSTLREGPLAHLRLIDDALYARWLEYRRRYGA